MSTDILAYFRLGSKLRVPPTTVPATGDRVAGPVVVPRPTVSSVIDRWGPWMCPMGLLGVAAHDGVPVTLKFWQGHANATLFAGDPRTLTFMVEPLLYSLVYQQGVHPKFRGAPDAHRYTCGADKVRLGIVTPPGIRWDNRIAKAAINGGIVLADGEVGRRLLPSLRVLIEQRLREGISYRIARHTVVVLHDVGQYWNRWPMASRRLWPFILENGYKVGVHVIVTLRYSDLDRVSRTPSRRIYGAPQAPLPDAPVLRDLAAMGLETYPPHLALVPSGGKWLQMVIPSVG